ncbi:hypothetical protein IW262DRAFT_1532227 [Armillaria fumosa]|nr:hypothetical protein IW262DRAFT_1532227 [Armillaria fumosa]
MAVASKLKIGDKDVVNAKGICRVLDKSRPDYPEENEIEDDIEGEQETWGDMDNHDDDGDMQMDPSISAEDRDYLTIIRDASKGVKEGTDEAYQSVMRLFNEFLIEERFIQPGTNIFKQKVLDPNTDYYIIGFIMSKDFQDDLLKLYQFNHRPENWDSTKVSANNWCGANMRRLLEAVYLVAFTCLLRIDEALKIQLHDLHFYDDPLDGTACVSVTLPFRKNSPYGKIPPFILRELPKDMAHLCPVRALAEWVNASEILHGYLFRRMDKRDRPIVAKNTHMVKAHCFLS